MISSCVKGSQPEQALEIFKAMKKQDALPNRITYNALISAYEKGNQLERALEIYAAMKERKVVPDVITYSALISGCEKSNLLKQALEIFKITWTWRRRNNTKTNMSNKQL